MKIVASIQARLGSTRLPGKVLFHLGHKRILQWVVDRVEDTDSIDHVFVTIGDQPENKAIEEYCDRSEINFSTGTEDDLLGRHLTVAEQSECDLLVRITADCPFVPSKEIDRVIQEHRSNDAQYTTNLTEKMPIGTAVDVISPNLLVKFESLGATHPVKLARENPSEWDIVRTGNPDWYEYENSHIAVDTPADYWQLTDALEETNGDPMSVAEWINKRQV